MIIITKKRKKRRKTGILVTNHHRNIEGKRYGSKIAYKSKPKAKQEAKTLRKKGNYSSVRVKPYSLRDTKGKKKKFHGVYIRK